MGELRKDYILDRWVIIASDRMKRPHEFKIKDTAKQKGVCYFCPGNEDKTPPEIYRLADKKGNWKIRVFPNKFPAETLEGQYDIQTHNKYFTFSSSYGEHEIIAETPDHDRQLWDLSQKEVVDLLKVYDLRITEMEKIPHVKYVSVFKNHGEKAGTSLLHSHSQIIASNIINQNVAAEVEAAKRYDSCPYCEIVSIEKNSDRRCFENDSFAAFCPYAAQFNFEVWIFPKKHICRLSELDNKGYKDLADIMLKVLGKLKELNVSYNYFLHYSPIGENLHFHIEVAPRLSIRAGFEFSSDIVITIVPPEDAAKFYRGENEESK
ncbi:MAG: galactose-1-phosphate uridylyltransferase [Nanoarchaeota archaeon]|nr:galactose-1-phosphate uridylyltransferase [Nanoarchaeota archaeon]